MVMQGHQTADPERRSHLLRKASTSIDVSSKLCEGIYVASFQANDFVPLRFYKKDCILPVEVEGDT
jgi:hypothetical protein